MTSSVQPFSPQLPTASTPLVSIIIPNYNHAQYVSDAINSVLNQHYRQFEIIVVDDGSTDNSREVINRFSHQIQFITQKNQGLSAARNTGIKAAAGIYIGLLDADDMVEPDFLSVLINLLTQNPQADGIYCGYRFVDHLNNPLPKGEARSVPPEQLYQALLDGNFLVPESILVHRQCYETVGLFDEALRAVEDWDMWLKISRQYKIIGTNKQLTRHRVLPGSMSTDPVRMLNNRLMVLNKHFGPEPAGNEDASEQKRRAYGYGYLTSCVEYLQYHDKNEAYTQFKKMAGIYPTLLRQIDVFYELGCGDQAKGYRGDLAGLDIAYNAQILLEFLHRLFEDTETTPSLQSYRCAAYANAYLVLGLLNYGAQKFPQARKYLFHAIKTEPKRVFSRQLIAPLLKSLLGTRLINWVRQEKASDRS